MIASLPIRPARRGFVGDGSPQKTAQLHSETQVMMMVILPFRTVFILQATEFPLSEIYRTIHDPSMTDSQRVGQ